MPRYVQRIDIDTIQIHLFMNNHRNDEDNDTKNRNWKENNNQKNNNKPENKNDIKTKNDTFPINLFSNIGIFHISLKNIQEYPLKGSNLSNQDFCASGIHFDMYRCDPKDAEFAMALF